jgi:uncharacterized protein (DUF2384 family)
MEELHLIQWLRRIQQSWELDLAALSRLTHVPESKLKEHLKLTVSELENLPTVPSDLSNAVALVSLFKRLQEEYPNAEEQNDWLKRPNSVLEGQVPVEVIALSPEHLAYVSYVVESGLQLQNKKS